MLAEITEADGLVRTGGVRGVTPRLVFLLRRALDDAGYGHVRIVASGGFDAPKIRHFEELGVPVDVYGVGSALVSGSGFDQTADIVRVNGKALAKTGRRYVASERLHEVDWRSLVTEADWVRST